jgi:hypothetical protein
VALVSLSALPVKWRGKPLCAIPQQMWCAGEPLTLSRAHDESFALRAAARSTCSAIFFAG